jgi:hypothetical protein
MEGLHATLKSVRDSINGATNAIGGMAASLGNIEAGGIMTTQLLNSIYWQGAGTSNRIAELVANAGWTSNELKRAFGQTNAPGALAAVTNAIETAGADAVTFLNSSGAKGVFDSAKGSFANMPGMAGADPRNIAGDEINLGSLNGQTFTMNLNPIGGPVWGDMWFWMKEFARWFLVLAYVIAILRDTYKVVDSMGQARQLQLPVINGTIFGIGGNWGAALYPVLLAAMMTAFGLLLAMLATMITDSAPLIGIFTSDPVANAAGNVGRGFSWLKAAFPLDTLASLAGAYAAWRLTMTGALSIFVVTLRALAG